MSSFNLVKQNCSTQRKGCDVSLKYLMENCSKSFCKTFPNPSSAPNLSIMLYNLTPHTGDNEFTFLDTTILRGKLFFACFNECLAFSEFSLF